MPRRLVARQIRRLERLASLVDSEVTAAEQPRDEEDVSEVIDAKIIKKTIELAKATTALLKEYRAFQREDQAACGIDNILRSLDGTCIPEK